MLIQSFDQDWFGFGVGVWGGIELGYLGRWHRGSNEIPWDCSKYNDIGREMF